MYLIFNVKGQELKRTDKKKVANESVDFLKCKFYFEGVDGVDEWESLEKYVHFKTAFDESVPVPIGNDSSCEIPSKVMQGSNFFTMMLVGFTDKHKRVTTNRVQVTMEMSGFEAFLDPEPPSVEKYSVFIKVFNEEGVAVTDANVKINEKWIMDYDSSSGYYVKKQLPNELYTVSVFHTDYEPHTEVFTIKNEDVYKNITLTKLPPFHEKIYLKVKNSLGKNITDAKVFLDGQNVEYNSSDESYTFDSSSLGLHYIKILKEEYEEFLDVFDIQRGVSEYNFEIVPKSLHNVHVVNTNNFDDCKVYLINETTGTNYNVPYRDEGVYEVHDVPDGFYTLIADKKPYTQYSQNHIHINKETSLNFSLLNIDVYVQESNNVSDVNVLLDGVSPSESSDNLYLFKNVSPGEHTLTANKEGYNSYEETVNVNDGVCLFTLTPVETSYSISLVVKNDLGEFITDANVLIGSTTAIWKDGFYTVSGLKSGYYNIYVTYEGYTSYSEMIELTDEDIEMEVEIKTINAAFLKVSNNDGLKDYNVYVNGNSLVYDNASGKYVGYLNKGEHDLKIKSSPFTDIKDVINLTEDTDYSFSFNGYDVFILERNRVQADVLLDGQPPFRKGNGGFWFRNITEGVHEFTAEYPGCENHTEFLTVTSSSVNFSFVMESKHEEYGVSFKLSDEETGELISDAVVKLGDYVLGLSGDYYTGTVPAGKYQLNITHDYYDYSEDDFEVEEVISKEYSLEKNVILRFTVSAGGAPTTDSVVRLNGVNVPYVASDNAYVIKGVKQGLNDLFISEYGYEIIRGNLTVDESRMYNYTLNRVDNVTFKIHQSGDTYPQSARLYLNDKKTFTYDSEQELFIREDLPVGVYKFKYKPIFCSAWEKEYVIETNITENITIPERYDVHFKEKNGLTDVVVRLDNLEPSVVTADGEYIFKNVPCGVYNLTAVLDGYETINENFTVEWVIYDDVIPIEMVEVVEDVMIHCQYQGEDIHKSVSVSISNDLNVYGAMYDESNECFRIRKALKGIYNLNIEHPILTNNTTQVNITPEQKEFNIEFTGLDIKIREYNELTNCEITIDNEIHPISTTNDGTYYFTNITEGIHEITADHTGYRTKTSHFNASIDDNEFVFDLEKDPDFNVYDIQIELTKNGRNYSKAIITSDSFTAQYKNGSYKATGVVEKQHQINIQFEGNTLQRFIDVDEDTQLFRFDLDYRIVTFKGIRGCEITLNGNAPDSIKLTSTDIYANAFYSFHARVGENTLKVNKPAYKQLIKEYDISLDNEIFEFNLEPVLNPINENIAVISLDGFSDCEVYLDDYHLSREGGDTNIYQGRSIPNGQYTLKVSKTGYIPFKQQITISNYKHTFYFGLIPVNSDTNLYPIDITTEEKADVYVDGIHATYNSETKKYTLYNISAAKHLLEVFKEGFEPYKEIINVSSFKQSFTATLTPVDKYELRIVDTKKMTGVNVKVDNNTIPYDSAKEAYITNIVADQYEITASKNGYDTFNKQIIVLENTIIKFHLNETPLPTSKVPIKIVPLFQPGKVYIEGFPTITNTFKQYFEEPLEKYMDVYVDGIKASYNHDDLYQVGDSYIGSYYAEVADKQHHTVIVNLKYDKLPSDLRKDRFPAREIIYVNSTENPSNMYTVSLNKYDLSFYDVVPVYESEFKVKDVPVIPRMKFKSTQNFKDCIVLIDNIPIFYEEAYDSYILYNALQDNYSSTLTVIKNSYQTLEEQFRFSKDTIEDTVEFTLIPEPVNTGLIIKPYCMEFSPWSPSGSLVAVNNAQVYVDDIQLQFDKNKGGYIYKRGTGAKHRLTIIADGFYPLYDFLNIPGDPYKGKGKDFPILDNRVLDSFNGKYKTATIECDVSGTNKTCTIPVYRASKNQYDLREYDDTLKSLGTVSHYMNLSKYTVYQLTEALMGFYFFMVKSSAGNVVFNKEVVVNSDKVVEKVSLSSPKRHLNMSWKFRVIDEDTKTVLSDCNVTLRENVTGFEFPVEYDTLNDYYKVYNVNYYNFVHKSQYFEGGYTIRITRTGYNKKETRLYEFVDEEIFKLKKNSKTVGE